MTRPRVLLGLALVLGCSRAPELGAIRDLRPSSLGEGDKLVIEGIPGAFAVDAPTEVIFEGLLRIGKAAPLQNALALTGRAVSRERVIVDIDATLAARLGNHTRFRGTVKVVQGGKTPRTVSSSARDPMELDLFPPTFTKLALGLVRGHSESRLFDWLGMDLAQTAQGLVVRNVRTEFRWTDFMARYDRPPLDGKIDWEREAAPAGVPEALFRAVDSNHNKVISRQEAEEYDRPASFAAQAGLRDGDLVVKVAGQNVRSRDAFAAAWTRDLATVPVDVRRGSADVHTELPRHGAPADLPEGFLLIGLMIAMGLLVLLPIGPVSGFIVVWERKISGRMQSRIGPNRVGPQGWLQWLADGIKLIIKEDIIPTEADPVLFRIAPYLAFVGLFLTIIVLPASQVLVVADFNIGLLYLLSVTSLVVVSILMGGWSSNSKWSLLGGMRSAAQIISYELPASVALLTIATMTGSLSLQTIVRGQGGWPWHWNLFATPMAFCCFFIYFISALAEGNRTPFDLPEAESELVSGYNTEYSGFRFGIFPMVEWLNLFVISAVATTLFLGGWGLPGISPETIEASGLFSLPSLAVVGVGLACFIGSIVFGTLIGKPELMTFGFLAAIPAMIGAGYATGAYQLASLLMFVAKVTTLIFVIIWIRWTLPRFRVDQMMNMCWKYFIPISFACFLATTAWVWASEGRLLVQDGVRLGMFALCGVGISVVFIAKVYKNLHSTKLLGVGKQIDLNLFH